MELDCVTRRSGLSCVSGSYCLLVSAAFLSLASNEASHVQPLVSQSLIPRLSLSVDMSIGDAFHAVRRFLPA